MRFLLCSLFLGLSLSLGSAFAASVGQSLSKVTIRDANDQPSGIPDFGVKVLTLFITDPDAADINDPFADKLKAADLDKSKYRGIGIAELGDTILPSSVVRAVIRNKIEKYDATILTDVDYTLTNTWSLGSTNGTGMVLIIDKKGVLRYQKKGAMSAAEIESGYQLVLQLMAE